MTQPNNKHIYGVDKLVSDTLSILPSKPSDKYEHCTRKAKYRVNTLFTIGRVENNGDCFPLNILIVKREQQKELRNINSNLSTYISDRGSGYSMQELDNFEIICYDSKICMPQILRRPVLDWYHLYINDLGVSRPAKTIREVFH